MNKFALLISGIMLPALLLAGEDTITSQWWPAAAKVAWHLEELTSKADAPEEYRTVDAATEKLSLKPPQIKILSDNAREYRFVLRNVSGRPRFLRPVVELMTPFAEAELWKGYLDPAEVAFDPGDKILSTWFPAHAAMQEGGAAILGVNPQDLYSRLEVWSRVENVEQVILGQSYPVYLPDGESFSYSFVVQAAPVPCGYRDVIQAVYDVFPEAFQPHPNISPEVISSEAGYLFWQNKTNQPGQTDLIRRLFRGQGVWEWCYKPFVRGGDWAITDEYSVGFRNYTAERVAAERERTRARLAPAAASLVAPMWYLNVRWSEWSIIQDHFPEAAVEGASKRRCWGQDTILGVYSWGGRYGKLFSDSLKRIPVDYPDVRGIGWDSCFAHQEIPADHAGFAETTPKSFYNGRPMALEAVGISNLLDIAHQQQTATVGVVMGNVVNFKLTSPFMIGARSDAGLYEGNPMQRPERFRRVEAMRMRLGSPKAMAWHKHAEPDYLKWVDWEDLSPEEAVDVYRQIMDDNLFLSYYWGGIPAPHMPAMGVENIARALPELVSLVKQGFQPSPGMIADQGLLLARYGQGAGTRLVVINPQPKNVNAMVKLPASAWKGKMPLLAAENEKIRVKTALTAEAASAVVSIPPRSVAILRVVALIEPPAEPLSCTGTRQELTGKAPYYRLEIATRAEQKLPAEFFRPDAGETVRLRIGDSSQRFAPQQELLTVIDTGTFPVDVQADNQRLAFVELHTYPRHDATALDPETARGLQLPELASHQQLAIVIPEDAPAKFHVEAQRIVDWFAFYTHITTGVSSVPAIVHTPPTTAAIILSIAPASLRGTQSSRVTVVGESTVKIECADIYCLEPAVLAFLLAMDDAYPYLGVLPEKGGFEKIGLAGKLLTPAPVGNMYRPTMMEWMEKAKLLP